jgi:hypothetical protein
MLLLTNEAAEQVFPLIEDNASLPEVVFIHTFLRI